MRSADRQAGGGAPQIRATRFGDDVRVSVPLANGKLAIVDLPFDKVRPTGTALLEVAHYYRDTAASLFDAEPTATVRNPRIELRATTTEEVLIAIDSGFLGPLILKLDADTARDLRDSLTMLFAGAKSS